MSVPSPDPGLPNVLTDDEMTENRIFPLLNRSFLGETHYATVALQTDLDFKHQRRKHSDRLFLL